VTAGIRLLALHGFLGRPSDWDELAASFPEATVTAIDLWAMLDRPEVTDWPSMSHAMDVALVDALRADDGRPAFLVAYSFGARVALSSALLSAGGQALRGVCLVSCNPGLAEGDVTARDERRATDESWAGRILTWPEPEIWSAWDAQAVFSGPGQAPPRVGLPASRETLARALTRFSLAGQPDFRPRLRAWGGPLLWMTGARDTTFEGFARALSESGVPAAFVTCADAGHRVPWDNPAAFAGALRAWMTQVMETAP
jgi:2-succinyl-6-hydroxy-2,4-cyclohexadiene-1-carboxylate synthase